MTNLVDLNLDSCQINDESLDNLEGLKRLGRLDLETRKSPTPAWPISPASKLRELDLTSVNDVTPAGGRKTAKIAAALPDQAVMRPRACPTLRADQITAEARPATPALAIPVAAASLLQSSTL